MHPDSSHRRPGAQEDRFVKVGGVDSPGLLLILLALALAVFGVIRLGQSLEPRQRIVLILAFVCGLAWLTLTLIQWGLLGQRTD
jgi:hypothetical protein